MQISWEEPRLQDLHTVNFYTSIVEIAVVSPLGMEKSELLPSSDDAME